MSDDIEPKRWVPPTWTWRYTCELYEMSSDELTVWIEEVNADARSRGLLEPVVVSDDRQYVTVVGSPRSA